MCEIVMRGILFLANLCILVAWFLWGFIGGGIITIVLSFACIVLTVVMKNSVCLEEILIFTVVGFFCYELVKRERRVKNSRELRLEHVQENKNTLQLVCGKRRVSADALQDRVRRYRMLRGVAQVLTSSLDFEKTASLIARKAFDVVGKGNLCILYLADVEGQNLALKASWKSKVKSKTGDGFDDWVLKQGQVLLVEDVEKDFRFKPGDVTTERRVISLISAPLISGENVIGVLRVDSETAGTFLTGDLRLLNVFAVLSAAAIENARLYRKTEELAITDGLTGLYVHRYFYERLGEELKRAMRSHSFLSFLMIDIDHFKNYNDRYGHSVGDIVLKKVADILRKEAGDGSVVARYGGEEFAIILPMSEKKEAVKKAELIREAIAGKSVTVRGEKTSITISVGVATFPLDAMEKKDIVRQADEALLRAKKKGRDKVCAA